MNEPAPPRFVALVLSALLLAGSGCATNKIGRPDWAAATEPQSATVWTFFWGAMPQHINPTNCLGPGLAEVTVRSNLGYSLISLLSLGTAMPVTIEWRCAKDSTGNEDNF